MAYNIIRQNDNDTYNYVELSVDTRAEVQNIPTSYAMGSVCICIEDSSVWMLGSDEAWHEL